MPKSGRPPPIRPWEGITAIRGQVSPITLDLIDVQ